MATRRRFRLPAGRQPYDPLNGLRVGALAGGLLGVVAAALTSIANVWLVVAGATLGGATGYWSEKRKSRSSPPNSTGGVGGDE